MLICNSSFHYTTGKVKLIKRKEEEKCIAMKQNATLTA